MYDSRIDRVKPDRNLLDPELEHMVASSLIEARHPHRYLLAVFEIGAASVVAGVLMLLLSAYGSTSWTPSMTPETMWHLLMVASIGAVCSFVGAVVALISALLMRFLPKQ